MDVLRVRKLLDDRTLALEEVRSWGVVDIDRAQSNFHSLAQLGVPLDLLSVLWEQLSAALPEQSDPDMALNNLERFFAASRSPLSLAALFERDPEALPILLQLFATSQHLSDLLVREPEGFDLIRITGGQPVRYENLVEDIVSEVMSLSDERMVMAALRRFKHRETLRICYGDIIGQQRIGTITRQISYLADAICQAAVIYCRKQLEEKRGVPKRADGNRCRFSVLALGKQGGVELNYSSDIDLICFYEVDGQTGGGKSTTHREFFERLVRDFVRILSENTELGIAYRVDLRLRPDGKTGPLVGSLDNMMHYYDVYGRTWERQAYVKARPVAGDLDLGKEFLGRLEPWIYRKYLSRADITGIKALKRRIEQRALREGVNERDVKTGHGGIRDIEFSIQFLQLLNGGELKSIRTGNTLEGIAQLEQSGCLTLSERTILEENYAFLRKIEHRLQIMLDLQTHELPEARSELSKLAIRMGYRRGKEDEHLHAFLKDLKEKTELNRKILNFLLHDAFPDDEESSPEADLILDPDPQPNDIEGVLAKYKFRDVTQAFKNLSSLAVEKIAFLSTRRCRHFLAAITARLLADISKTPDPDMTLINLVQVSDSLGGKGVLWELFSVNPPTQQLYVRLCATSPFLATMLVSNPGMIDELMDSLVLDKLPSIDWLRRSLTELCRGAEDIEPALHAFKNAQQLRVGVRDILGKESIRLTHQTLSDIAEVILQQVVDSESTSSRAKYGVPRLRSEQGAGPEAEFVVLAMGKLGGREPNYHSDLDVVFLYDGEGETQHRNSDKSTSNQHYFTQLATRVVKTITSVGPYGRLYELDARLRPTGKSGSLAVSLDEFVKYFESGNGQLWERQALCKARTVYGSPAARKAVQDAVYRAITIRPWTSQDAADIRAMRYRLQDTAGPSNIKRGIGGTVDIEFAIQMLQLKYAIPHPQVLIPGTLLAAEKLMELGVLDATAGADLVECYTFLRAVEARLRLMNLTGRHEIPEEAAELEKLAYFMRVSSAEELLRQIADIRSRSRARFDELFSAAENE